MREEVEGLENHPDFTPDVAQGAICKDDALNRYFPLLMPLQPVDATDKR